MRTNPEIQDMLKKYFSFSIREYRSALALLLITVFVWSFSDIKNHFFPPTFNTALLQQKANELNMALTSQDTAYHYNSSEQNYAAVQTVESLNNTSVTYFPFNPNTASDNDFTKLGLSKKQIHTIRNFLEKVGEIKTKKTFSQIYGIPKSQFEALESYLNIPEEPMKHYDKGKTRLDKLTIELNTADSLTLDLLPGIGMGYARRIIKYRNALGGFTNIEQLLEVYGFRVTLLDSIKPFLTLNTTLIKRININTAPVDSLKKHPYIRYKIASAIFNYRVQHGNYNSLDTLKKIVLIDEVFYDKIKYYLTVD